MSFKRSFKAQKPKGARYAGKKRRLELEEEKREIDSRTAKWPESSRNFKCWNRDDAFDLVRDVLKKRGWKDRGRLCNPEDLNELNEVAEGKRGRLYSRCLWWVHEIDARRLIPLSETVGEKHCISTFISTDAAVTKAAITEMLNGKDFYPTAYVLPKERKAFLNFLKNNSSSYWITKPRNDYAGNGCMVYHCNHN